MNGKLTIGTKYDGDKPQVGLMPYVAIDALTHVMDDVVGTTIRDVWGCLDDYKTTSGDDGFQYLRRAYQSIMWMLSDGNDARTAIEKVVRVLEHGAVRYAPGNWRHVKPPSRYYHAACRHLLRCPDLWDSDLDLRTDPTGVVLDPDSGLDERAHVACCLAFMLALEVGGVSCRPEEVLNDGERA